MTLPYVAPLQQITSSGWNAVVDEVNALIGGVLNVQTYGAVGDGATDDTAAIQAAIEDAYAAGGGLVVVPPGVYLLSANNETYPIAFGILGIRLRSNVHLEAPGGATLKMANGAYASAGALGGVLGSGAGLSNVRVRGLTLDTNRANNGATTQFDGALLYCVENVHVERVTVPEPAGDGIMLRGMSEAGATVMQDVSIRQCKVTDAGRIGLQVTHFDGLLIEGNTVRTSADNGIDVFGENGTDIPSSSSFVIAHNIVTGSSTAGVFAETVVGGRVVDNVIDDCLYGVIVNRINGDPASVSVTDNTISNGGEGVVVDGTVFAGVLVAHNFIRQMSTAYIRLGGTPSIANTIVRGNMVRGPIADDLSAVPWLKVQSANADHIVARDNWGRNVGNYSTVATSEWRVSIEEHQDTDLGDTNRMLASGALQVDGQLDHNGTTVGFYGATPIVKPTGVAVTAAGIHAALVSLGLIGA